MENDLNKFLEEAAKPRKKASKRIASEQRETIITNQEGEKVASTLYKRSRRQTEPDFVKLYLADVKSIRPHDLTLLVALASRMAYDTHLVVLLPRIRAQVAAECGFKTDGGLKNAISRIVKANLILPVGNGEYMINPNLLGRGTWEMVDKARQAYSYARSARSPACGGTFFIPENASRAESDQMLAEYQKTTAVLSTLWPGL